MEGVCYRGRDEGATVNVDLCLVDRTKKATETLRRTETTTTAATKVKRTRKRSEKKEIEAATRSGTNKNNDDDDEDKDAAIEKESRSVVVAIEAHDENVFRDSLGRKMKKKKKAVEAPKELIEEAEERVTRGRAAKRIALSKIGGR